jgi:NADH-quinone oxidoreductase subunit F
MSTFTKTAETHPLTWRIERLNGELLTLPSYESLGGFAGLRKIFANGLSPRDVQTQVKTSGLRGRGGAGFPTGVKWSFVPMGDNAPKQKYLICNADEMEPGTFKDRMLMEFMPHLLLEGMIISSYALQASVAYIFLRGEFVTAAERLEQAIAEAKAAGYLGANILNSGFDTDIFLHTGAGRYICGEETALINCLEGRRANPRTKPPYPQVSGLWGKPSVVNNVETLANIPGIMLHGTDWYKALHTNNSKDAGTKLYGISGRTKRTGLWELPIGVTGREILEEHAGGMQTGLNLTCWLPGGASTDFLLPEHLDLPMDYDTITKAGSRMGTGLMMVIDNQHSIVSVVRNLMQFSARESCGWCTPCRDGLPWLTKILTDLEQGKGKPGDMELLEQATKFISAGKTFCAHGPGATAPLQSALKFFRAEFERGIANVST